MEKSLAQIAMEVILETTYSSKQETCERVAKAVEKEVLARLNKSESEPVPGQELTHNQVLDWIEKHGSTKGLQWRNDYGKWCNDNVKGIYSGIEYRVAPKKVNDPDDPTTWAEGAFILVRNSVSLPWLMGTFIKQVAPDMVDVIVGSERLRYLHAKLATADQIEAWNKTQED